jgi:hypothetical protein
MENKQLQLRQIHTQKVLDCVRAAGAAGITHSRLLQVTRYRTAELGELVQAHLSAFRIVRRQQRASEFGLGRQPTRYWLKEFAPAELTAETGRSIPTLDLDAAVPRGGTCRQCGGAIPVRGPGHPPDFCSPACRRLWQEGGLTLGRFLDRASDPLVFAQVARLLVIADLALRGYKVADDVLGASPRLIVHDGETALFLMVVPISTGGYFPPGDEYDSMAAVFKDGRIVYGGRNPLFPADAEPAPKDSEPEK